LQSEAQQAPIAIEGLPGVKDGEVIEVLGGQGDLSELLGLHTDEADDPARWPIRLNSLNSHGLAEERAGEQLAGIEGRKGAGRFAHLSQMPIVTLAPIWVYHPTHEWSPKCFIQFILGLFCEEQAPQFSTVFLSKA
jgi:hypothetical protein